MNVLCVGPRFVSDCNHTSEVEEISASSLNSKLQRCVLFVTSQVIESNAGLLFRYNIRINCISEMIFCYNVTSRICLQLQLKRLTVALVLL